MSFRSSLAVFVLAVWIGASFGVTPASAAPFSNAYNGAGPIDIVGTRGITSADLSGATREAGEPTVAGSNTDHTVWWRYVPASSGFVRFSTCAQTGMNPVPGLSLGLYTGSQVNLLTTVSQATNNCPAGFENAVLGPVAVTAGTYYWLQIGGSTTLNAGETDLSLTMDFNATVPTNDNWASALVISGAFPQSFAANNGLATTEVNEPRSDATTERQSLWYRWTATADGTISINNCGSAVESGMDSVIGVFTGTTPATAADMTYVNDNDNGCPGAAANLSRVYIPVTNGTKYWIKLSNYSVNYGFPYALQMKWVTTPENGQIPSMYPTRFKVGTATSADSDGVWGGYPTPTLTRQWRKCDAAGSNCTNIAAATGISYTPVAGDVGSTIVLRVTATNVNGVTSADSFPSEVVDTTPANDLWANATNLGTGSSITVNDDNNWATHNEVSEPSIGATLARNTVWYKWTPAASGTFVINNCLGGGSLDFLDLMIGIRTGSGSLATTTAVGTGDNGCGPYHSNRTSMLFSATAGTTYWIEVASKTAGATGSFALSIAIAANPVVTVPPSLTGTAAPGGTLNLDIGDWISPVAISPVIHWYRCDSAGSNCVDTGQSGTAYGVLPADSGGKMKATVTLTNPYGTVTNFVLSAVIAQDSDGDGILDGADTCPSEAGTKPNGCLPSDIVAAGIPTITGNLVTGQTLTSSTGTWSVLHDPLGYTLAYQWQRCNDATPGSCSNIGGATGNTYTLVVGDLTKTIRVGVTATNTDDAAQQYSAQSIAVTAPPPPPSNSTPPAVSGTKIVGQTLSTTDGTWTPAGVGFTYVWLSCTDNVSVGSCTPIGSQTASSYTLVATDLGKYIRSQVTGSNVSGNVPATSAPTSIILGDGDGDGVPDTTDVCPAEAGTKPNGCLPSDIVAAGAPSVSGTLVVGQTVSASGDTWNVLHDPLGYTLAYQWQRCNDATPGSCSNIAIAATSNTYVLTGAEYQKRVRVIVTATNTDDSATQFSSNSAAIDQVPGNTIPPALSGTPRVTAALTTTQGTWVPAGATLANTWLRCTDNVSPASCTTIPSQTGASYTLVAADDGKYIRSRVTGTTTAGSTPAESAPSAKVITDGDADGVPDATDVCAAEAGTKPNGCLPSDIVAAGVPTLSGTLNVGQTITSTTGSWNVLHDPLGYTLAYQWQRCPDLVPANCVNIATATASTYALVAADYGKRVRVNVTATNADDTALQSSAISALVSQVPANTGLPAITGTPKVGQVLTGAQGTWTPLDATLANVWLRCLDTTLGSCSPIASQTGSTYTLVAADDSKYIRLQVTGTTTASSVPATSAATAQITTTLDGDGDGVPDASDVCPTEAGTKPNGCLPSDIVAAGLPTLSGTFNVGQSIATTTGSWTVLHDPLGYTLTYQWQRCTSALAASCSNIAATGTSYTLVAADYGNRVRVNVTATNADDVALQSSAISNVISQTPVNNTLPTVSGTAKVGQVITAGQGTWTPADAALTNVWMRCTTTAVGSCSPIASQTGATYTLVGADDGRYIRVQVTGTTTAGIAVATSAGTAQVITDTDGDGVVDASDACPAEAGTKPNGCLPSVINSSALPTISGNLVVGSTMSSTTGSWTVLHDQLGYTLTYQWQRCDDASTASCANIGGAASSTYVLTASELTKRVRVIVTATNADSTTAQASAITTAVIPAGSPPVNNVPSTVTGTTETGQLLTATGTSSDWTPANAVLSYEWLRCTDTGQANCSVIGSATASTYTLVSADVDNFIRVRVTATASALTTQIVSASTAKVTIPVVTPPTGGTTPPVTTPPALPNPATITGPASLKTMKPSKKGLVNFSKVSVYCGSTATGNCTGLATLTGKVGGKTKKLGTLKLSSLRGGGRSITLKVNKATLKALKQKAIKAQLSITYSAPGFTPLTYLGKVTLKKP